MNQYKVKNKLTGAMFNVLAETEHHAINKAIKNEGFKYEYKDYKVIK